VFSLNTPFGRGVVVGVAGVGWGGVGVETVNGAKLLSVLLTLSIPYNGLGNHPVELTLGLELCKFVLSSIL